jgi:hypothetical protein
LVWFSLFEKAGAPHFETEKWLVGQKSHFLKNGKSQMALTTFVLKSKIPRKISVLF